jgi:hypothetical protein
MEELFKVQGAVSDWRDMGDYVFESVIAHHGTHTMKSQEAPFVLVFRESPALLSASRLFAPVELTGNRWQSQTPVRRGTAESEHEWRNCFVASRKLNQSPCRR